MYKLICTDVDGTLIDNENKISERTKEAFLACQDMGIKVVIASGRPDLLVFDHLRTLELPKYGGAISNYNGTKVTLCDSGEVISDITIDIDSAKEYLEAIENYHFDISIFKNGDLYSTVNKKEEIKFFFSERPAYKKILNDNNEELFKLPKFNYYVEDKLSKILNFEPYSIQIAGNNDELLNVFGEIHDEFQGKIHLTFTSDNSIEGMPEGVTKSSSLKILAKHYGVDMNEILTFGDSQNDYEMIRDAGCGVAMGNAQSIVKDVADYVTLPNTEDGIAVFLENNVLR